MENYHLFELKILFHIYKTKIVGFKFIDGDLKKVSI